MNQPALFDAETMRRTEALTPAWAEKIERLLEEAGDRPWYITTDARGPMIISFGADIETDEEIYVCNDGEAISARADAELVIALVNAAHLIAASFRRTPTAEGGGRMSYSARSAAKAEGWRDEEPGWWTHAEHGGICRERDGKWYWYETGALDERRGPYHTLTAALYAVNVEKTLPALRALAGGEEKEE